MLFPGPEAPPATSIAELVRLNGTCLWQHIPSARLPPHQVFDPLREKQVDNVDQCVTECLMDRGCTGYVHFGEAMKSGGNGRCVLYKGIKLYSWDALKPRKDMEHCTAGIVRPGLPEIDSTEPNPTSVASALRELPKAIFGQGHLYSVLDVHHCAAYGNNTGRYAMVSCDDLQRPTQAMYDAAMRSPQSNSAQRVLGLRARRNFLTDPKQAEFARIAKLQGMDVVKMVPDASVADFPLTAEEKAQLESDGYRVVFTPWVVPPGIQTAQAACAKQDFVRLNALTLTEYDAVLVLDSDVHFYGDVRPILRCASRNFMLTTSGPMSPLNLGVWAFKPNAALLETSMAFAKAATYTKNGGGGSRREVGARWGLHPRVEPLSALPVDKVFCGRYFTKTVAATQARCSRTCGKRAPRRAREHTSSTAARGTTRVNERISVMRPTNAAKREWHTNSSN